MGAEEKVILTEVCLIEHPTNPAQWERKNNLQLAMYLISFTCIFFTWITVGIMGKYITYKLFKYYHKCFYHIFSDFKIVLMLILQLNIWFLICMITLDISETKPI